MAVHFLPLMILNVFASYFILIITYSGALILRDPNMDIDYYQS